MRHLIATALIAMLISPAFSQSMRMRNNRGGAVIGSGIPRKSGSDAQLAKRNCKSALKKAKKFIKEKNYSRAISALEQAKVNAITIDLRDEIIEQVKIINRAGNKKIKEIDKLVKAGKFLEAAKEYKKISRIFTPLKASQTARKKHRDILADPQFKDRQIEAKAAKLDKRIEKLLKTARKKYEKKRTKSKAGKATLRVYSINSPHSLRVTLIKLSSVSKQAKIYSLLKTIIKKYPDTKYGSAATDDLASLKKDEAFMSKIKKHKDKEKLRALVSKARMFDNGNERLKETAIETYKLIVKKYPKSDAAKNARKRLRQLR